MRSYFNGGRMKILYASLIYGSLSLTPSQSFLSISPSFKKINEQNNKLSLLQMPPREESGHQKIKSFSGKLWSDQYENILLSPMRDYFSIIMFVERFLSFYELNVEPNRSQLKTSIMDSNIPEYIKSLLISNIDYSGGAFAKKNGLKKGASSESFNDITQFKMDFPSDRPFVPMGFFDEVVNFWIKHGLKKIFEVKKVDEEKLKKISIMASRDYDYKLELKEYFMSHPILSADLLSQKNLKLFMGIVNFLPPNVNLIFDVEGKKLTKEKYFEQAYSKADLLNKYFFTVEDDVTRRDLLRSILSRECFFGKPLNVYDLAKIITNQSNVNPVKINSKETLYVLLKEIGKYYNESERLILCAFLLDFSFEDVVELQPRLDDVFSDEFLSKCRFLKTIDPKYYKYILKDILEDKITSDLFFDFSLNLISDFRSIEFKQISFLLEKNEDKLLSKLLEFSSLLSAEERSEFSKKYFSLLINLPFVNTDKKNYFKSLEFSSEESAKLNRLDEIFLRMEKILNTSEDLKELSREMDNLLKRFYAYQDQIKFTNLVGSILKIKPVLDETVIEENPLQTHVSQLDKALKTVEIEGILLPCSSNKDLAMIPNKSDADLVMTTTARKVLKQLAGHWRIGNSALLKGPTSAGKTSYIKYLAYKTKTPYRRINLSYHTDVRDLIGRWVAGDECYSLQQLIEMDGDSLLLLAQSMGLKNAKHLEHEQLANKLFDWQKEPHWEDGPVVTAIRRGEILLLDEINLARPQVIESLNGLFDSGKLTLDDNDGEVVTVHEESRIFATMNPSSYSGRHAMSDAFKSRCTNIWVDEPSIEDLAQIIQIKYPHVIPSKLLAELISSHLVLVELTEQGKIGSEYGGLVYTLRNLFRVIERYQHFKKKSSLSASQILHREFLEVYLGPIYKEEEVKIVQDSLLVTMPYSSVDYYKDLELKITDTSFSLGDVDVILPKKYLNDRRKLIDEFEIVMTHRTKVVFYKMIKALELGEHVALVGERASGKTMLAEFYAILKGQPFYREVFSEKTDNLELIGMHTPRGWQDGQLLKAGRPATLPGIFLADEFNQANEALQERLNSLLDKDRKIVLAERGGEEVVFHPDFRFIGAFNPPNHRYQGRKELSLAMRSRLSEQYVPELEEFQEYREIFLELGAKKGIPAPVVEALIELHFWIKDQLEKNLLGGVKIYDGYVFSIRSVKAAMKTICEFAPSLGMTESFQLAAELNYEAIFEDSEDRTKVRNKTEEITR